MHGKQNIRYEWAMKRKIFSYTYYKCICSSMKIKIIIYILLILYTGRPEHRFAMEEGLNNKNIYLHHDPFKKGELLTKWIKYFKHKLIVLNVKEEGLEKKIIKILKKYRIKNYFFHDQSFSSLLKNMNATRVSVRFSEYEELKKTNLPDGIGIGGILGKKDIIMPRSNFIFKNEDTVVFLAKRNQLSIVENMFRLSSV